MMCSELGGIRIGFIWQRTHNKQFHWDQSMLSCLLRAQKPRLHALAFEHGRYTSRMESDLE